MLAAEQVIDGRYRIVRALAEGGMGSVFLAEHLLIKKRVALKLLHRELAGDSAMVKQFMAEATAAGTLGHPHLVESFDMGFTADRVPFIVFEYLDGQLLYDVVHRARGLPVARAIAIATQIASALELAHRAGIAHLDLKPNNVMLLAGDHVKVLDFGLARMLVGEVDRTLRHSAAGTPNYMAPEQVSTPERVDARADIYGLGAVMYEMLSARQPFTGADARILLYRVVNEQVPSLGCAYVPPELEQFICEKLLAKDAADRPQTMAEVRDTLTEILGRLDAGEPEPAAERDVAVIVDSPPRARRRRANGFWLLAAATFAVAGGVMETGHRRVVASIDGATRDSLARDAAKLGALVDGATRAARARANDLARWPVVRAAVQTDRAAVAELIANQQLVLGAASGETIELIQKRKDGAVSLARVPELAASLLPATGGEQLVRVGEGLELVATAEIPAGKLGLSGQVAVAQSVDLATARALVAQDAVYAIVDGLGAPLPLVGEVAPEDAIEVRVPVFVESEPGLALVARVPPIRRGETWHLAGRASLATAGLFACCFGVTLLHRRRPEDER